MEVLLIGLGGALGATLRYLIGVALPETPFPWPTLIVNALGSFVLGAAILLVAEGDGFLVIGVGFCGAFTTFSTFSYQTMGLWERDDPLLAMANAVGNLLVALLAFGSAWVVIG